MTDTATKDRVIVALDAIIKFATVAKLAYDCDRPDDLQLCVVQIRTLCDELQPRQER